jgi:outer membrane lipoprotein-sorting protein
MNKTVMFGLAVIMAVALALIGVGCKNKSGKGTPGSGSTVVDKGNLPGGKTPGGKTPDAKTPDGKTPDVEPGKTVTDGKTGEGPQPGSTTIVQKPVGDGLDYQKKPETKPSEIKSFSYTVEADTKGLTKLKIERKVDGEDRLNMKVWVWEGDAWKDTSDLINDGKNTYLLTTAIKTALKSALDKNKASIMVPKSMLFVPKWENYQFDMLGADSRAAKIGPDKIDGVELTKYKVDGLPGVAMTAHVWVDKDGIIHQIEGQDEAGATSVSLKVDKVNLNPKFSDEDFSVPADYKVTDATAPPAGGEKTPGKIEGDKKTAPEKKQPPKSESDKSPEKAPEKSPDKEKAPK